MKAIIVQQPFAYEIMSGQKTIEVKEWDTLHRGDLLICSAKKPAFSSEEMEDLEEEYGCVFAYGQAICIVELTEVRLMRKGDEEKALEDEVNPEAYSWVLENARPVIPFPVKGKDVLFEVGDGLITPSPFQYDQPVLVKSGAIAKDFGIDFSGWRGRVSDLVLTEEGEPRVTVIWDSLSLRAMPVTAIEACERAGIDWTAVLLRLTEIEGAEARDTWDDVRGAIEAIEEENPSLFGE